MKTKELYSACSALIKVHDKNTIERFISCASVKQRKELLQYSNDETNLTLLHLAIIHHNYSALEILMRYSVITTVPFYRIRGKLFTDVSPLFLAIAHHFNDGFNLLKHTNPQKVTECGLTALSLAALCGNEHAFTVLLNMDTKIPLQLYKGNQTSLMMAAEGGNFNIVQNLVKHYNECGSQYLLYEKNNFGENVYHYLARSKFPFVELKRSLKLFREIQIPVVANYVGVYPTPFAAVLGSKKFAVNFAQYTTESLKDIRILVYIAEYVFTKSKSREEVIHFITSFSKCSQDFIYLLRPFPLLKTILCDEKLYDPNEQRDLSFEGLELETLAIVVAERLLGHFSYITKSLTYHFAVLSLNSMNRTLLHCAYQMIVENDLYLINEADLTKQLFLEHWVQVLPKVNKLDKFNDIVYKLCLRSLTYATELFQQSRETCYLESALFVLVNSSSVAVTCLMNTHIDNLLAACDTSKKIRPIHYLISLCGKVNETDLSVAIERIVARKKSLLLERSVNNLSPFMHALKMNSQVLVNTISNLENNVKNK